jgi:decaprenylphospho-beta-D-erythro-pentofuranosid-2-ulose 2-reductase
MRDAVGGVQSVLVLGGRSEIALATVRRLVAGRTRTVVLAARKPSPTDDAVSSSLLAAGAETVAWVDFDATATAEHAALVEEVFEKYGDFDVVLLAFGVLGDQSVAEHDAGAATAIATANYVGPISVAIPLAERMRTQGHGRIVAISSVAGERARRSNFVYGSSKAGFDAFFQGLGDALAGSGVGVLVVRPGFVTTKMTAGMKAAPLAVDADTVAAAIVEGLRRDREVIWVPGALRWVMSVLRHLPRPIFRRLPL